MDPGIQKGSALILILKQLAHFFFTLFISVKELLKILPPVPNMVGKERIFKYCTFFLHLGHHNKNQGTNLGLPVVTQYMKVV